MNKKTIVMILMLGILLVTTLIIVLFSVFFSLPKGTTNLNVRIGIAKIDQEVAWEKGALDFFYGKDAGTEKYMKHVSNIVKTVKYDSLDNSLKDAQCVEFNFLNENESVRRYIFAYDFYTKKLYGLKDDQWYSIEQNDRLDSLVIEILKSGYHYDWLGQSTYIQGDNFERAESNGEMTFRYGLYWRTEEETRIKTGRRFYPQDIYPIENTNDALICAAKKLGMKSPMGFAFFDETTGYWLVEMMENTGHDINSEEFQIIAFEDVYAVVLDENGVVIETYRTLGGSTYKLFLEGKAVIPQN